MLFGCYYGDVVLMFVCGVFVVLLLVRFLCFVGCVLLKKKLLVLLDLVVFLYEVWGDVLYCCLCVILY